MKADEKEVYFFLFIRLHCLRLVNFLLCISESEKGVAFASMLKKKEENNVRIQNIRLTKSSFRIKSKVNQPHWAARRRRRSISFNIKIVFSRARLKRNNLFKRKIPFSFVNTNIIKLFVRARIASQQGCACECDAVAMRVEVVASFIHRRPRIYTYK